jgi:hypothetical protein
MALDDIKNLIIGSILFVVVISGGVIFLGSFSAFDSSIDSVGDVSGFNSTLNKARNVTDAANSIQDSISSVSNNPGILGWFDALFGSIYNGLKAMFGSLSFISTAMVESVAFFGFDIVTPLIVLLGLVIVVVIGFAIWSAITKVN